VIGKTLYLALDGDSTAFCLIKKNRLLGMVTGH
jgi:hypothetical protein